MKCRKRGPPRTAQSSPSGRAAGLRLDSTVARRGVAFYAPIRVHWRRGGVRLSVDKGISPGAF